MIFSLRSCSLVYVLVKKLKMVFNPYIEAHQRNKLLVKENITDKELVKLKCLGYSFIFHSTKSETQDVIVKYFDKDIVEKSFYQAKPVKSVYSVASICLLTL